MKKIALHATAAFLALFLLAGCDININVPPSAPPSVPETQVPVIVVDPSATPQAAETEPATPSQAEPENVVSFAEMGIAVGFDYPDGFTQGFSTSFNGVYEPNAPFDLPYPQNAQILFNAYPGGYGITVNGIRIFRVDEINALEAGAVENLNAVLEGQVDHHTDFPRMAGAGSVIDAQLSLLPFQNGNGYRYLVTKSFSADPIFSTSLTYMYQGITNDDKYFVSFLMSVDAPFLAPYIGQPLTTVEEFEAYFQTVNSLVDTTSGDQFTPSLTIFDELIASLIIIKK